MNVLEVKVMSSYFCPHDGERLELLDESGYEWKLLKCSKCGGEYETDTFGNIDMVESSEERTEVKVRCPFCGRVEMIDKDDDLEDFTNFPFTCNTCNKPRMWEILGEDE